MKRKRRPDRKPLERQVEAAHRRNQVFDLARQKITKEEIAERLGIPAGTVKFYLHQLRGSVENPNEQGLGERRSSPWAPKTLREAIKKAYENTKKPVTVETHRNLWLAFSRLRKNGKVTESWEDFVKKAAGKEAAARLRDKLKWTPKKLKAAIRDRALKRPISSEKDSDLYQGFVALVKRGELSGSWRTLVKEVGGEKSMKPYTHWTVGRIKNEMRKQYLKHGKITSRNMINAYRAFQRIKKAGALKSEITFESLKEEVFVEILLNEAGFDPETEIGKKIIGIRGWDRKKLKRKYWELGRILHEMKAELGKESVNDALIALEQEMVAVRFWLRRKS